MSTETAVATQEITQARGLIIIEQAYGNMAVCNTELITQKMLDIMVACLDDGGFEADGHGLLATIFRDDNLPNSEDGTPATWMFYPNSLTAVCNLKGCINIAFQNSRDLDTPNSEFVSIYALVWKNMIQGFFHEAYHANSFLQEGHDLWDNKEARAKEEEKADEYARTMLFKLAKTIDVEIEFSEIVADMISEHLHSELEAIKEILPNLEDDRKDDQKLSRWYDSQKHMINNGGVYYDASDDSDPAIVLKTFKEFLHVCSGDAEDDAEWGGETIGQMLEVKQVPAHEDAHGNKVPQAVDVAAVIGEVDPAMSAQDWDSFDDMPDNEADEATVSTGFQGVSQFTASPMPAYSAPANTNPPVPVPAPMPVAPPIVPNNPAVVVGANMYPEVLLPAGVDAKAVVYGLYVKIANNIFQGCQYNPTHNTVPFTDVGNIANPLQLDQYEALFVKEMTCYSSDGKGTWCKGTKVEGVISGVIIDKAKTLPAYELTLSTPEGTQIKRKFIPQNPNKVVNGQYTNTAADAKAGNQLMWIVDPDTKAYSVRVYNNVVERNENGKWVLAP